MLEFKRCSCNTLSPACPETKQADASNQCQLPVRHIAELSDL